MTASKLISILATLPGNATVVSNSGWECDPTDIGGIYYCKETNEIHLTQGGNYENDYGYNTRNSLIYKCIYNYVKEADNENDASC